MHPKKILHPTDYSETSRPALDEALRLAEENSAGLVLLHVVDTLGPTTFGYAEGYIPFDPEELRSQLWEELRHVLPADTHAHVEYVLSEEDVVTAILRTQIDFECDLIVMGTQGKTGWRRWLTTSTAEEIVRRASCPVLVVKPPRPAEKLPSLRGSELHPGRLVHVQ
jgi:nucleotide-binding universal stress UspA family protein